MLSGRPTIYMFLPAFASDNCCSLIVQFSECTILSYEDAADKVWLAAGSCVAGDSDCSDGYFDSGFFWVVAGLDNCCDGGDFGGCFSMGPGVFS